MMRQILVDAARAHNSAKRGSGNKVRLTGHMEIGDGANALEFLPLHEALETLQEHNPRLAQAVELRYFGGLELEEIAASLSISLATAKRDLTLGKAWLRRKLTAKVETK
jgi:RNA polymerase sigma factor (TIGR02999 family)